ncbi:pilus assembly FimT family protein [Deinococcus phoenicis]|uniref:pilus assembly FimT family protein n=1 Tax=Deinococcus phoenicis TaxID=1476583 RepID=UPI000553BAC0|nr:type II secretion system protein [Deinococcus phoenicis]
MRRAQTGFTLLEVLVVLAIVGILMGIFGWGLVRSIRTAELREAATQVATDFRRARSQAQRGSADTSLILPTSTASAAYTASGVAKTLPSNVTMVCKTNCGSGATTTITYQAPYGELGATGSVFTIKSPTNGIGDLEVRIVGVTGKVILTKAGS